MIKYLSVTDEKDKKRLLKQRLIFADVEEFKEWREEIGEFSWSDEYYKIRPEDFDIEKYYLIDWDGHPTSGAIDYALREGYQLFTWKYTKEIKDEDMYYVRIDPYIEEHLQSYSQTVKKSLFRHSGF